MSKIVEITPEIRRKLAGIAPMSPTSTYTFVPESFKDLPEEFQSEFTIVQLSQGDVNIIKEKMMEGNASTKQTKGAKGGKSKAERDEAIYTCMLSKCLRGWSKVYDLGTGEAIEWDGTEEGLLIIPSAVRLEVFNELLKITGFLPKGVI